jgi:hypothetical protein
MVKAMTIMVGDEMVRQCKKAVTASDGVYLDVGKNPTILQIVTSYGPDRDRAKFGLSENRHDRP